MGFRMMLVLCLSGPLTVNAQENDLLKTDHDPNRSNQFSIAAGAGMAFSFTDVNKSSAQSVFGIGAQYAAQPWLGINLDLQFGKLKGGDHTDASQSYMEFRNNFFYSAVTARFYPLRLVLNRGTEAGVQTNIKYLGGLYAGVGAGIIVNKVDAYNAPETGLIADRDGAQIVVPGEVGYMLPVAHLNPAYKGKVYGRSQLSLYVNYRHNLSFSEKLDGYNPPGYQNKSKDAFSTLTFGLVYNL